MAKNCVCFYQNRLRKAQRQRAKEVLDKLFGDNQ